jgi:DNA recombination protein RmuC
MDSLLVRIGGVSISYGSAAMAGLALVAALLIGVLVLLWRAVGVRGAALAEEEARDEGLERRLADLLRVQSEMTGRMQTMAEIFSGRTSDLARLVNERLDSQGQRLGAALQDSHTRTAESLSKLAERLAVIDRAQANITQLSQDVVSLQSILANKQTRGAFGQGRMEAIVADGLAPNAYAFQYELSNRSRPDCVVFMPNGGPCLVIDAKFPLESWQRFSAAQTPEEARAAGIEFRNVMGVHIRAIAEKYLIPGETQDTAFLFVPSESIFADLHEKFAESVQRAARSRVVIVSPSILMLSIQVMQALLRDVRMREEAHRIQSEVRELLTDVGRLDERVRKLQTHFQQANTDIESILVSAGKVTSRGEKIEAMDFEEEAPRRLAGE